VNPDEVRGKGRGQPFDTLIMAKGRKKKRKKGEREKTRHIKKRGFAKGKMLIGGREKGRTSKGRDFEGRKRAIMLKPRHRKKEEKRTGDAKNEEQKCLAFGKKKIPSDRLKKEKKGRKEYELAAKPRKR